MEDLKRGGMLTLINVLLSSFVLLLSLLKSESESDFDFYVTGFITLDAGREDMSWTLLPIFSLIDKLPKKIGYDWN